MLALVDTHCHLNHAEFDADREEAVERARAAGVRAMVVIGYDLPSSERAVALARSTEPATGGGPLWATVGIHPHDAETAGPEALRAIQALARDPRVVAIGEIGLDFYRNLAPPEAQERAFRAQVEIALKEGLPAVIHTRASVPQALAVLLPYASQGLKCVLHCWSGTAEEARQTVEAGWWLGLGGVLTFKNAPELPAIAAATPLERLLLETDAPYLAPHPHRGRRNEPSYLPLVAERLAALKGLSLAEVAVQTTQNALALFPRMRLL